MEHVERQEEQRQDVQRNHKRQYTAITLFAILGALALFLAAGLIFGIWDPVERNARAFGDAVKRLPLQTKEGETVYLAELTPFAWDDVYAFDPYTSRAEMEKILGFSSKELRETVSEGMIQLVFVNEEPNTSPQVVCCIASYPENLGYSVKLGHFLNSDKRYMRVSNGFDPFVFQIKDGRPILSYEGYTFDGTIMRIFEEDVLVYIDDDDADIRLSGEEVYVRLPEDLMEIAEEDVRVRITYDGYVRESSPLGLGGQIDAEFLD